MSLLSFCTRHSLFGLFDSLILHHETYTSSVPKVSTLIHLKKSGNNELFGRDFSFCYFFFQLKCTFCAVIMLHSDRFCIYQRQGKLKLLF